jgi:hypothetical protein
MTCSGVIEREQVVTEGRTFCRVFIPAPRRGLTSTNDALEHKFLDGYRKGCKTARRDYFRFAELASDIKELVVMAFRSVRLTDGLVDLRVIVRPHAEWDDDAGLINAKWVVDGLVLAGLWRKDRRVLRWVSVRTDRDHSLPAGIVVEIEGVPS